MLYYHALTGGLDTLPPADAQVRAEIDAEAARRGWPALHAELARIDERTAQRLAPNDAQRVQRALEVWLTGRPLSSLQGVARQELPFELKGFALMPERAVLHERIASASTPCSSSDSSTKCAGCANAIVSAPPCRACARSAIGRYGSTSKAAMTRLRSERALPRRDSWQAPAHVAEAWRACSASRRRSARAPASSFL